MSQTQVRKRVKVSDADTLGDLFKKGVPSLSEGNESMQSTPHVYDTGHGHAAIFHENIPFPNGSDPPFMPEDTEKDKSFLLLDLTKQSADRFTYQNETKIQYLVTSCLKDALSSQDLYRHFGVENEFSVFACRPDIVVVSHDTKGIILVIEVKKPGLEVFSSPDVGGQVYDYLVGKLLAGTSAPFAVLTTYDEMCIAHLNDGGVSLEILARNADALDQDISGDILRAFGIGISDDSEPPSTSVPPHSPPGESEQQNPPSPESMLNRVYDVRRQSHNDNDNRSSNPTGRPYAVLQSDTESDEDDEKVEDAEVDRDEEADDEDRNREVIYTQTFGRENGMKALVLALRCGLEAVARNEPRNAPMPGETAIGSCARVNEKGLVWLNIPSSIAFEYNHIPGPTTRALYLWKDLGRGRKGRVFLACNSRGKACAAKFFLLDYDTYHRGKQSEEARNEWRETQMKLAKAEAEKEKQYWTQIYGGIFKKEVCVLKLNNHWCLLMPYFGQIPDSERATRIVEVKKHLEDFRSMGLRYNVNDLRWRHIGLRKGSLYIFDLGSLEECEKSVIDIASQIDILGSKIKRESSL